MRAVKKLKLVHVKLIRGLHHEGIAAADELSADARDVSKEPPRGALARAYLDRAGGAYDWGAAQYGGRAISWSPLKSSAVSPAPAGTPQLTKQFIS